MDERFWNSTRGRIVLELRRENRTVNDLAEALALTDNAVRAQLTAMERDGLVRPSGSRPGKRKPNVVYELTTKAEQLFPKVYGLMLRLLLDEIKERMPAKKVDDVMRTLARKLAPSYRGSVQSGKPAERIHQALEALRQLGGFCDEEDEDGKVIVRCFDCPLSVAVVGHPELCHMMETLLSEVVGLPVQQRCQSSPAPQCHFEIEARSA